MDKLLQGIVASNHPVPLKKALASKVIDSYKPPDDFQVCFSMLEMSTRFLQQNVNEVEVYIGELLLNRFAQQQPSIFSAYFSTNRLIEYIDNISFSLENIIRCIRVIIPLKDLGSARKDCVAVNRHPAVRALEIAQRAGSRFELRASLPKVGYPLHVWHY